MSIKNAIVSDDDREFRKHKKTIADRQRDFVSLGQALGYVRIKRLYKIDGYATFEDFVEQQCEISRSYAYRMIEAARVVTILSPTGDKSRAGERVKNEAQARALIPLGRDRDAMLKVLDAAAKRGRVTGAALAEVRVELYPHTRVLEGEFREGGLPEIEASPARPDQMSVGSGVVVPLRPDEDVLCPLGVDHAHCQTCHKDIPSVDQQGGYLRCRDCDKRQEHIAEPVDGGAWGDCRLCAVHREQRAAASVSTEPAQTGLGGSPTGATSPVPVGESPEERDEEVAAEVGLDPGCEKCGGPLNEEEAKAGFLRCEGCDPDGEHARSLDLDGACGGCGRIPTNTPAAATTSLPDGDGDPMPEPEQQPGQDSPTDQDRSDAGANFSDAPESAAIATTGRSEIDHHQVSGVSPGGEAPAPRNAVEPEELEDGGASLLPSPSDYLMLYAAQFALRLAEFDPVALGPQMLDDDVATLLVHVDGFEDFVKSLIKARNP